MWSLVKAMLLCLLAYGLYRLIRRLRINPALWRIIYALIGLIVVLVVISVPEIRNFVLGWLEKISDPAETLLVLSILCLIICVLCRTRPARQSNSQ
jgi:H+/Cl- antiporter ClcA